MVKQEGGEQGTTLGAFLVAQMLKSLPEVRETRVQFLGREDPLKEMATHSSTLSWKIPWIEEPGTTLSMGSQRMGHNWATSLLFFWWSSDCQQFALWFLCLF